MKIAYKIRNECFLLARRKICHFLDPRPSTLDILPSTKTLDSIGSRMMVRSSLRRSEK